jgi:hypothetical protein
MHEKFFKNSESSRGCKNFSKYQVFYNLTKGILLLSRIIPTFLGSIGNLAFSKNENR